ncbi:MAG: hypothetical protein D6786_08885 [Gammaproteobacteria bacterium]|nr:MAG: hypothetical protein D6786_08885 [Gammaproteobacteria bacterium]
MKIRFDDGPDGFFEARELKRMVLALRRHGGEAYSMQREFLDALEALADGQMGRPEFSELLERMGLPEVPEPEPPQTLLDRLRALLGPTARDLELSRQRREAIDRAERAERSAFEALAELAETGRQRDALKARLKELEQEIRSLKGE